MPRSKTPRRKKIDSEDDVEEREDEAAREEAKHTGEEEEEGGEYNFDLSEYDSNVGEPVGITHLFLNCFLNASSPDANTRIVSLKTILMLAQPFTDVKTPERPGWQSSVNKSARMVTALEGLDDSERQAEAVKWGFAQRVYDEEYEDNLREAVNETMKSLIKSRLLNWSEMFGQAPSIRPNTGMDSFRLRGGR